MPALTTTVSRRPSRSTAWVTASRIAVGSALSALIAKPVLPSSSIARTVSAALSGADTYVKPTLAPSLARRRAAAAPMPRDPPNTIATLPVSLRSSLIPGSIIDRLVHNSPHERAFGRFKGSARFQAFDDKPCLSPKRRGVDAAKTREMDAFHRHLDERTCRSTVQ